MRTTCDRTNPPFHFMKEKVKFSALIKKDVDKIMEEANFTDEQMKIFSCLLKDKYTDVGIMEITKIPHKRYYEVKKIISEKIIRVMNKQIVYLRIHNEKRKIKLYSFFIYHFHKSEILDKLLYSVI